MEGRYFYPVGSKVTPRTGPYQIVRRDCGDDHHELARIGVYFSTSLAKGIISVLYQFPSKMDSEGRIEELSLVWLSPVWGAIPLPPTIFKIPNYPISTQLREQLMKRDADRFRDCIIEACAKYGIRTVNTTNEVKKVEDELVNLMLTMNLAA